MRIIRHHAKKSAAASPRTRNDYLINEQQKDHRLSVLGTSLRRLSSLALSYKCKLVCEAMPSQGAPRQVGSCCCEG